MPPQAYFIKDIALAEQVVEFNGVPLRVPVDAALITRLAKRLRQDASLRRLPIADIVDALAETARRWLSPSYSFRQIAEEYLPRITGYSRPVIARGLDHLFCELSRDNLWALLEEEFSDPLVLDEWRPRRRAAGKVRAFGPRLTLHVIAGNIPGIGVQSLIFGLLVKSPSIVKLSTDEPLLTALFAQSLHEIAPELARCAMIIWWPGRGGDRLPIHKTGSQKWHKKLLEVRKSVERVADLVVVYGNADTIKVMEETLLPPPIHRLVAYGHRYSLAVVARECVTRETARALALDVAMYDKQGCLSPQLCWVESSGVLSPQEFARALADELESIEAELPSGDRAAALAVSIQQVRAVCEMSGGTVYGSTQGVKWTVILSPAARLDLSAMPRGILMHVASDLNSLAGIGDESFQAIGLAAPPERAQAIIEAFAAQTGVNRFCPLGKMQFPPLLWHHDGRPNLGDFVRWVDWEEG